ncbi:rab9 effector protein with kelch motifs isoform X2 [Capsicum annuum]
MAQGKSMIFMCWMSGAKSGRNTNVKAVHLHSHTATLVGGDKLVVFGGSGKGEANYLNDLHVLDLKTMRWSSPEVRGELNRYQGDIDVLDMDTLMLSKLDVLGPSPGARASHASVNFGSKVFLSKWLC